MEKNHRKKQAALLGIDFLIILASLIFTVLITKAGILEKIISYAGNVAFLESFISGMFFTTIFTTVPAIAALGTIAQQNSYITTAFFGACGAVAVDLGIFRFMKDRFSDHLSSWIKQGEKKSLNHIFMKLKAHRWITFFIAGFILASPLPDELGISLLGFSKMGTKIFVLFSFISNFIGILIIGITAQAMI